MQNLSKNKVYVAGRQGSQFVLDSTARFKILFECSHCKKEVEPDKVVIGRAHVYMAHCGSMQEVGCVV